MSIPRSGRIFTPLVLLLACFAGPTAAQAHEKWFVSGEVPALAAGGFFSTFCLTAVAAALALTAVAEFFWRRRGERDLIPGPERLGATDEGMARFYGWVPVVIGIHFAVPLLVLGVQGRLFSPNNVPAAPWNYLLGTWQIAIALSFLYGGMTRVFAASLAVLWVVAGFVVGWETTFENLHYLGAAVFFFCKGRGPHSIDQLLFPRLAPSPALAKHGLKLLRISMGVGFVFVAFTEKLANPALALTFLEQFPLNFTGAVGFPLSNAAFIWFAGTTELLIGLFLAFGIFPRVIIIAAWGIINLTLTLFSWVELVGHLPIYGIMAVLLVWAPSEKTSRLMRRGILGRDAET
ncbi:hypothetical protein Verru16b_01328 [Lacunisphaera limnophila]|uniref:DoxX n=1 Tax=Lacunisphaera limnophila TaxID=1838286 RepID=A0A1D8ATQ7_9BACT|nr:hypothetical protein [Lacunisphaera limnophila]AOS44267.1 hypothetical protein Verru16b_01328 [Lacunisphaera limnophila]